MVKEARRQFDEKERQMEREEAEQEEAERQGSVRFKSLLKPGNAFSEALVNSARANEKSVKPKSVSLEEAVTPKSYLTSNRQHTLSLQTPRQSSEPMNAFNLRNNFSRLQIDKDRQETHIYDILKEGSPTNAAFSQKTKTSFESGKPSTTSEGSEQKKSSLRKVTGKFKAKPEKSPFEDTSPTQTNDLHRPDLVSFSNVPE